MPNAPLKGALSHQPRVTPWGNRNVTTDAPYRGKSFIVGGNAYAPPGRNYHTAYNTQGVALGYLVFGPPGRRCTDELLINPNP